MKKKYLIILSILPAFLWILLVYYKTGILFETNDDRYISEILAGTLTGIPEAHTTYVNYLLCLPLMLLYRITGKIAWYGILLVISQAICYSVLFYSFYKKWRIYSVPFYLAILCSELYMTGLIQYTSTAALLAITGYVCLCLFPESRKTYGIFFIFELLAFLIRNQAMLIIQPVGFLTFLGLKSMKQLLASKNVKESFPIFDSKHFRQYLFPIVILLFSIIIGSLGNYLGYHSDEWKEYLRFNDARTEMFDYYGVPDYASAKSILDNYNVSEAEYLSFCNFTILDQNLSADCLQELAELSKNQYYSTHNPSVADHLTDCIVSSIQNYASDGHWLINSIPLILWLAVIIGIVIFRNFAFVFPVIGLFLGRTISWTYLLYRGRIPARVSVPMYVCEIIFLVVILSEILLHTSTTEKASRQITIATLILGLLFMIVASRSALIQYRYIKQQNQVQATFDQGFQELQNYCLSHPDNIYLIEAQALGYYKGDALSASMYQPRNSLATGCWYSGSPCMTNALNSYIGNCKKTGSIPGNIPLYFIAAAGDDQRIAPILTYLSEYTGSTAIMTDQFTVSHGGTYLVYCYE